MVVDAAITRLDLAEASPDARGLVEAALPALERAGYLREIARAKVYADPIDRSSTPLCSVDSST